MDALTSYEIAAEHLLAQLGPDSPHRGPALVLQSRLTENIKHTRLYGDNETRRSERAQIVDALNRIAVEALGVEIYPLRDIQPPTNVTSKGRTAVAPVRVFVSYAHEDREFAAKLTQDLKGAGFEVWYAEGEIRVGESIVQRISRALQEGDFLIVVLSPDSVASDWVQRELNTALMEQLSQKQVTVLPVLWRDCPLPFLLKDLRYADFRADYESGLRDLLNALGTRRCRPREKKPGEWWGLLLRSLRDPVWQGIDAIVALIALVVTLCAIRSDGGPRPPSTLHTIPASLPATVPAPVTIPATSPSIARIPPATVIPTAQPTTPSSIPERPTPQQVSSQPISVGNCISITKWAELPTGQGPYVIRVTFSPDGNLLASSGNRDYQVHLWDVRRALRGEDSHLCRFGEDSTGMGFCDGSTWGLVFSRDGKTLYSGCLDGTVRSWSIDACRAQGKTEPEVLFRGYDRGNLYRFALDPGGTFLAMGFRDGHIVLFDLARREIVSQPVRHGSSEVHCTAISPDGRYLAVGNRAGQVLLWAIQGKHIEDRVAKEGPIHQVGKAVEMIAFSPKSNLLASGSQDTTAILWDMTTEQAVCVFTHTKWVRSVAFSPDGTVLATGGSDGEIKLWDVSDCRLLHLLNASEGNAEVIDVTFSPDGTMLASAHWDGYARIWGVNAPQVYPPQQRVPFWQRR